MPVRVTTWVEGRVRNSSAVQARTRPQPLPPMQAFMASSILPQRVTGPVNQARPVLALRLSTPSGTDSSQASTSARYLAEAVSVPRGGV